MEKVIEPDEEDEQNGQIFGLTEVANKKPKKNLASSLSVPKETDNKNVDFMSLSPKYIIDTINEAEKKNEKVQFKGIGIESTMYYKRYMSDKKEIKQKSNIETLKEKYIRSVRLTKRPNEHIQSFNRIKEQMQKISEKQNSSFVVAMESNLDNAFKRMEQDLNRVNAYAKYSFDFP